LEVEGRRLTITTNRKSIPTAIIRLAVCIGFDHVEVLADSFNNPNGLKLSVLKQREAAEEPGLFPDTWVAPLAVEAPLHVAKLSKE